MKLENGAIDFVEIDGVLYARHCAWCIKDDEVQTLCPDRVVTVTGSICLTHGLEVQKKLQREKSGEELAVIE